MTSRRFQRQPPNRLPAMTVRFDRPVGRCKTPFFRAPERSALDSALRSRPTLICQPPTPPLKIVGAQSGLAQVTLLGFALAGFRGEGDASHVVLGLVRPKVDVVEIPRG